MYHRDRLIEAVAVIQSKSNGFKPVLGIVLGSGLGALAEKIENKVVIPYSLIPGFPESDAVKGHSGQLVLGDLNGTPVACLQGRSHYYEKGRYDEVKMYVRALKLLGCEYFLATNAAGSFHAHIPPGSLVCVTDHINFQGSNPLIGLNDDEFGPRFPPLDTAYDADMRKQLHAHAQALNIPLHEGVYIAVLGPSYETAAEIRTFKMWGADVVGMSTVPEVIVAVHCGMKVGVISTVTNYVTGLSSESHDHDNVVAVANKASESLTELIYQFAGSL